MKILFVGDGPHDIGREGYAPGQPSRAAGVVATLSRKVCPQVAEDSLAVRWTDLVRFHPQARQGYAGKVAAAVLLAARRFDCDATICVADRDRKVKEQRLQSMMEGQARGLALVGPSHIAACGLAIESIEAWTLGSREALAAELGLDTNVLVRHYPGSSVEDLYEGSGRPELRPKTLLRLLAQLAHRADSVSLREAVAARTDIAALERACPGGFAPFAAALRRLAERPASCEKT